MIMKEISCVPYRENMMVRLLGFRARFIYSVALYTRIIYRIEMF
jgi:hypothetical protein